jgi:acetolactate synthase-1/2/3 large subunit
MLNGRKGPVHINLPMDVQSDSIEIDEFPDPVVNITQGKIFGDPNSIKKAVDLLINAERPTILIGGGLIHSEAFSELIELVELTGAAVVSTMMGKSGFPENHPLYGWHTGSKGTKIGLELTSKADILLALGARFADETASSYKHGISFSIPPTKLIHVDIDPYEIGKNYRPTVGIVGDIKAVLKQMIDEIREREFQKDYKNSSYFKQIQSLKKDWFKLLDDWRDYDKSPVMISVLIKEIREAFDEDTIFITSSGNIQAQVLQEMMFYKPKTHITTGGFSTMGFALPASIGIKLAAPDKEVVGLIGDGDFMMTIQELSTAVQLDLPVIEIIINNMGWIAIKDLQMAVYGEDRALATDFFDENQSIYSPDFKKIAEGFGCYAEKISEANEIKPAIKRAIKSNKPAVIEVIVNREYPFSGSPAHGWWDVPIPTYLEDKRKKYEQEKEGEEI